MDIEQIKKAWKNGCPVAYTKHCQQRMLERGISRYDIRNCVFNGEIIEDYSQSNEKLLENSYPSCLILGFKTEDNTPIHVVIGFNGESVIVISVCYPDREHWFDDNRTRRRQ